MPDSDKIKNINIGVMTVSDSRTMESDISGKRIVAFLKTKGYEVPFYKIVTDDISHITATLKLALQEHNLDLILTVGGTGFGSRDNTPEATLQLVDKVVPGLSERIRSEGSKNNNKAYLSRGAAGIKDKTLIVNLPGSPKGSMDSLDCIIGLIPHSISMIKGEGH